MFDPMFQLSKYCLSAPNSIFTACSAKMDLSPSNVCPLPNGVKFSFVGEGIADPVFLCLGCVLLLVGSCTVHSLSRAWPPWLCCFSAHCQATEVHSLQLAAPGASSSTFFVVLQQSDPGETGFWQVLPS